MRRSDSPSPSPQRFVPFAPRYRRRCCASTETTGPPRFPGKPRCVHALLLDPGVAPVPRHDGHGVLPSAILTASALLDVVFSGLDHTAYSARCLRFAATVARAQRKTRFRLVARPFAGRDRPAGFAQEGFSTSVLPHLMASPFPGLSLALQDLTPDG